MKKNKYRYLKVIQQNYGIGWEDASEYEDTREGRKDLRHDVKEYRLLGYPTRIINRRELNV